MDEVDFFDDPFGEEFDSTDVINKGELKSDIATKGLKEQVRKDPEFNTRNFSQSDIDQLVNYDHERRKRLAFKSNLGEEISINPKEKTDLENQFRDFIVYPRISGNSQLRGDSILIPESQLKKSEKIVEIIDAPKTDPKHNPATVVVNRDENGDIDNINIICECGDRILLKFEKADLLDLDKLKLETQKLTTPVPFNLENSKGALSTQFEDDFLSDDDEKEFFNFGEEKKNKKAEIEEEFFDDNFGGDINVEGLDIDLSGIL